MQVLETTLQQLIQGEKQFRVPLFQRQYTWGTKNHAQLWTDILDQYERLDNHQSNGVVAGTGSPAHFMGSLVLSPIGGPFAQHVASALVVDGQQRLTTLMLVLCAIRDARAVKEPGAASRYDEKYLINSDEHGTLRYRLLPTQADRAALFACVDATPGRGGSDGIGTAYRFFASRLAGEPGLDLDRLTIAIVQRLVFVDITTDAHDNPHRIFESLNATGVGLTQADLLRNFLFMLLPTRADEVYENVWHPMEVELGFDHLEGLARVDIQRRGVDVTIDDVYRQHQKRLEPLSHDEGSIEREIRDLALRAKHYKRLVDPSFEADPDVQERLRWLRSWGGQTVFPLLMHLLDLREQEECSSEDLTQALTYIESFLVRRLVTGVSPKALNRLFIQLIGQIDSDKPVAEGIREALSEERHYWATDDELRAAIRTRNFYFSGRWEQKYLILRRIEESYQDPEMVDFGKAALSIEHILPQTLSDEWRAHLAKLGQDADTVRAELVHILGNLTLTAYNGTLSNNPFERKKQILEKSNLRLNRDVRDKPCWGRDEILARADELADVACGVWPGPLPRVGRVSIGFDWSRVDAAVAGIPAGGWTSYGDLAELGGTSAQAVGSHVANDPLLMTGYRVLAADGKPSLGFRWGDPSDQTSVIELLVQEGITFDANGAADPALRLNAVDLVKLVGEGDDPVGTDALATDWDELLIDRAWSESKGPMRSFMHELAKRRDEWVAINELSAALDLGTRSVPGMLGAFTVRCRNRYKRSSWPFQWEYHNFSHGYKMSGEVAEVILRLER